MLKNRKFTDKDIKLIEENMVILVDTREKNNNHILDWLEKKARCEHKKMKLNQGDYSFMLKAIPEIGITEDLYYNREFVIERKNSLEELSSNFTKERARFEHELSVFTGKGGKMILAFEDTYTNLFMGTYDTKYNRKSFIASVMTFWHRYDVPFVPVSKNEMGVFVYTQCLYYLKECLK